MKRVLMLFVLALFAGTFAFAQTVQITGTVTSSEDGLTIPGVAIVAKGTTLGVTTGIDGSYTIIVPSSTQFLEFSFIGMKTQEVEISGRTTIDVVMELDLMKVDEVVVIGYGTAKKVGTVVGSVAKVDAEKLADKPSANVFDALQGKVAGVQTYSSSGEPSQTSSVRLHGVGSLGASNTPLYVVDGMPISSGSMLALNANDFENITILKDASATSIYGSRAANGVVYITTKAGKRNQKAKITINSQYGISKMANEEFYDNFLNSKQLTDFWVAVGRSTQAYVDQLLQDNPYDTKWHKFYFAESAPTTQTNVSVSGGTEKTSYFVSGGYYFSDGLADRSEYERYSFRSNIDTRVNDWINFGFNLSGATDRRETNPSTWNSTNLGLAMLAPPYYTPYDENGDRFEGVIPGWGRYDPLYREKKLPSWDNRNQMNGNAYIMLNPIEGLTIRTQVGLDAYFNRGQALQYASYLGSLGNGSNYQSFTQNATKSITNTAEYKFNIQGRHAITLLAGQEGIANDYETFSAESTGQTDDRLMLLSSGPDNKDVGHGKSQYAYLSYFGRLDYNLDRKYYFDFSLRQDASSRFGANNRTATFYAVGAMWDIKKELFLETVSFISSMNLKASIGTSGNSSIGNYDHLALVGTSQFDGGTSWGISNPGNPDLSWEEQTKATIGLRFSLLEEKFRFNIEYYSRTTKNQLIDVPYPYTSGFNEIKANVGAIKNSGIDFEFDFDIIRTADLYITPYVNFSYNKNEITELFQGKTYWSIPNTGVAWVVGQPVSFYYPIFAGVDPADGAPMWYVPGDDITVNTEEATTKDFVTDDLLQNTGLNRYTPMAGGFGLTAGYKGISLSADFAFALGKNLLNNDRYFFENPNVFSSYNQSTSILDYWKQPGDETTFPSYSYQFTQFDSRLIEDASFMRLKNLTVSYTLPEQILNKAGFIEGARIFVTGRNLLTFTNYSGPDPEVDSNLTLGANPNTKQYSFGFEIDF